VEHRCFRRVEVRIPVALERRGRLVGWAVLRDVGDSGLGLELGSALRFRPAEALTVRLSWQGRWVRLRGIVVHSGAGRLGVLTDRDVRFLSDVRDAPQTPTRKYGVSAPGALAGR